jgi:hypothetical protein
MQHNTKISVIVLCLYLLMNIFFLTYFEWHNAIYHEREGEYAFFSGLFGFCVRILCVVMLIRALRARAVTAAAIYTLIIGIGIGELCCYKSLQYGDMYIKAYLISKFPALCPGYSKNVDAVICYDYWLHSTRQTLVYNPNDEMALPAKKWPEYIQKKVSASPDAILTPELCSLRNTRLLLDHIYYVSDDCWN